MKVQLISKTSPCQQLQDKGIKTAEDLIVYAARVSNPRNQLNTVTGAKLLAYCMEHGHWSVFEQASMGVEIVTSRAISAQILRHRSFHFQEFSQPATDFEPVQLRKQAEKNRQSSSQEIDNEKLKSEIREYICDAIDNYEYLLEKGVARECARMILPMCTQTTVYMTGTVRDWIHYLRLRLKEDTQLEHRKVAEAIMSEFQQCFPIISGLLKD